MTSTPQASHRPETKGKGTPASTVEQTTLVHLEAEIGTGRRLHETLGPYTLVDFLGQGGMAIVYKAIDEQGRHVALKVLHESAFLPAGMLERFRREAEATRLLGDHPHIVTVYRTGCVGRNHYIAMEWIPGGRSLDDLCREAPQPVSRVLPLAVTIAETLQHAHAAGIIHRDVKPANVLLTEDEKPILADFGLARFDFGMEQNLTVTAMSFGTPRYMAPEQASSLKAATFLSDMYSFGVILYELLTGSPPYEIHNDMGMEQIIRTIRERVPVHPRRLRPDLPRPLCAVILKLLEKDPRDRYANMAEVAADLTACLNRSRVAAHSVPPGKRLDKILRRHSRLITILLGLCSLLAAGYLWHKRALRTAQFQAIAPYAEAASQGLELARLQGQKPSLDQGHVGIDQQLANLRRLLLQKGQADTVVHRLRALLAKETDPDVVRDIQRALARALLAANRPGEAFAIFNSLRHHFSRERTLAHTRHGEAKGCAADGQYGMACFEEAMGHMLLDDELCANQLWQEALNALPATSPEAQICRGALGQTPPAKMAVWAASQRAFHAACALTVAALRTRDAEQRNEWCRRACRLANPAVPWLYYILRFGPYAPLGNSPSVNNAKENSP